MVRNTSGRDGSTDGRRQPSVGWKVSWLSIGSDILATVFINERISFSLQLRRRANEDLLGCARRDPHDLISDANNISAPERFLRKELNRGTGKQSELFEVSQKLGVFVAHAPNG